MPVLDTLVRVASGFTFTRRLPAGRGELLHSRYMPVRDTLVRVASGLTFTRRCPSLPEVSHPGRFNSGEERDLKKRCPCIALGFFASRFTLGDVRSWVVNPSNPCVLKDHRTVHVKSTVDLGYCYHGS